MSKICLVMILCFLSLHAFAAASKASFKNYSSGDFFIPYPVRLSPVQIISKETRRLIHFLKRAFVGISANYTTGRTYSNYGPIIGVQLPSRVGMRVWGGMSQGRTMDMKRDSNMDSKMSGVNGHRVGMGIKLAGDLSLDLEYQTIEGEQSMRNNSTIMSLSVPLNL